MLLKHLEGAQHALSIKHDEQFEKLSNNLQDQLNNILRMEEVDLHQKSATAMAQIW